MYARQVPRPPHTCQATLGSYSRVTTGGSAAPIAGAAHSIIAGWNGQRARLAEQQQLLLLLLQSRRA